tara:strand:- start:43 stop:306 length:264 start_codon:yes stop_codon:yes gene_type:complete
MSKLWELESALTESQGITKNAKYIDTLDIQSKLANLAEEHGLAEEMEEALDNVRVQLNKLQSAIFECDEVFNDAVREEWLNGEEDGD